MTQHNSIVEYLWQIADEELRKATHSNRGVLIACTEISFVSDMSKGANFNHKTFIEWNTAVNYSQFPQVNHRGPYKILMRSYLSKGKELDLSDHEQVTKTIREAILNWI